MAGPAVASTDTATGSDESAPADERAIALVEALADQMLRAGRADIVRARTAASQAAAARLRDADEATRALVDAARRELDAALAERSVAFDAALEDPASVPPPALGPTSLVESADADADADADAELPATTGGATVSPFPSARAFPLRRLTPRSPTSPRPHLDDAPEAVRAVEASAEVVSPEVVPVDESRRPEGVDDGRHPVLAALLSDATPVTDGPAGADDANGGRRRWLRPLEILVPMVVALLVFVVVLMIVG